jgi:hypothetical protein
MLSSVSPTHSGKSLWLNISTARRAIPLTDPITHTPSGHEPRQRSRSQGEGSVQELKSLEKSTVYTPRNMHPPYSILPSTRPHVGCFGTLGSARTYHGIIQTNISAMRIELKHPKFLAMNRFRFKLGLCLTHAEEPPTPSQTPQKAADSQLPGSSDAKRPKLINGRDKIPAYKVVWPMLRACRSPHRLSHASSRSYPIAIPV